MDFKTVIVIFLQNFNSFALIFPEPYPAYNLKNSSWNWNSPQFEPVVQGRQSDWTWRNDLTSNSEPVGKTLSFEVLKDRVIEHKTKWPPPQHVYDPYAFQHRTPLHRVPHQNQLHVYNHLDASHSYQWQQLRPTAHYSYGYSPHALQPPRSTVLSSGDFGSAPSATSHTAGTAVIDHDSSHAQAQGSNGIQTGHGHRWDGPRFYPHYPLDYRRKRYRVEVHPGFIAAPIAGLAAFGVAHALTSKPVLFELGLADKKKGFAHPPPSPSRPWPPHFHHHDHITSRPHYEPHYGGHDHHVHAHVTGRPHHGGHDHQAHVTSRPHHGGDDHHAHAQDPILYPTDKPNGSRPWWSPFAAMIPRLREDIERD